MNELTLYQEEIHQGSLILINRRYPYRQQEKDCSLVPAHHDYPEILLERNASAVLSQLMKDLGCEQEIIPVSGYRSLPYQRKIYQDSLVEHGKEFTEQYVALPNHSEHQTGLAIDLAKRQREIDFIRPHFPQEGICGRFRSKAPEYGFIERYQSGKEAITGIAHEPWHFRYVGYPHSKVMADRGISMEEYIELIREYPYGKRHLTISYGGQEMEITFLPMTAPELRIRLPEHTLFQKSGNNVDGIILTLWRSWNE